MDFFLPFEPLNLLNLLIYRNMGVRIFLFDNYHHLPCPVREGVEAEQGNGVWVDGQDDEDAAHKVHHHAGLNSTIKIIWYKCSNRSVGRAPSCPLKLCQTSQTTTKPQPTNSRTSNQRIEGHDGSWEVKLPLPINWSELNTAHPLSQLESTVHYLHHVGSFKGAVPEDNSVRRSSYRQRKRVRTNNTYQKQNIKKGQRRHCRGYKVFGRGKFYCKGLAIRDILLV